MATKILIAALALTFSACGGGGSSSSGPTEHPVTCTPRLVTVALLGDSTQYGADSNTTQAPHNPGVTLQAEMDGIYGFDAVKVTNYAVSGSTVRTAPSISADVVVANYGINDAAPWGEPLNEYTARLMTLSVTLFETPNPVMPAAGWDVTGYAQAMRDVAALRGIPVADVHAHLAADPALNSKLWDGVHPTDATYVEIVTKVLAPAVKRQVDAARCK